MSVLNVEKKNVGISVGFLKEEDRVLLLVCIISSFNHLHNHYVCSSLFVCISHSDFVVDQTQAVKFALDIACGMAFLHTLEPMIPRHYLNSKSVMVRNRKNDNHRQSSYLPYNPYSADDIKKTCLDILINVFWFHDTRLMMTWLPG